MDVTMPDSVLPFPTLYSACFTDKYVHILLQCKIAQNVTHILKLSKSLRKAHLFYIKSFGTPCKARLPDYHIIKQK